MKNGWIYILKLENSKWYVGWTNNPKNRMRSHFYRPKVGWLRDNPPLDIHYQFYGSLEDESSATLQLAHQFGISNVRGGAYTRNQNYHQERLWIPRKLVLDDDFWLTLGIQYHSLLFVKQTP